MEKSELKKIIREVITETKNNISLEKYVNNPYGIGAERVSDEGKFYSLLFSDSSSRNDAIIQLITMGINKKNMANSMQPKGREFRYELTVWK